MSAITEFQVFFHGRKFSTKCFILNLVISSCSVSQVKLSHGLLFFTVKLLIDLPCNVVQTPYLYFFKLNQITLRTSCVYHIMPNTLECLQ